MQANLEHSEGLARRIRVTIPGDQIDTAVKDRVKQIGKRAKIPGFRPGKAPASVLFQRYAEAARAEVVEDQLTRTYPQALQQVELKPAGYPTFDVVSETAGSDLEYTASFEVYPEIELNDLSKLSVEIKSADITDEDIDRTIKTIREQHITWKPVDRAAADGDQIKFDFLGKLDGEPFDGGAAEGHELVLGAGQFIPDMEAKLIGLEPGTETTIEVKFPDDYQAKDLAGKDTTFDVTIHEVREGELPAADAPEVLKGVGVDEDAGLDALKAKVREGLEAERDKTVENQRKQVIFSALADANPVDVPTPMVAEEIKQLRSEAVQRFPNIADDPAAAEQMLPDTLFEEQARRRAGLGLLVQEVIKAESVEVTEEEVEATLQRLAAGNAQANAEQIVNFYRGNPQMMQQIKAVAVEDKVVSTLLDKAKVKESKVSFEQLVNPSEA